VSEHFFAGFLHLSFLSSSLGLMEKVMSLIFLYLGTKVSLVHFFSFLLLDTRINALQFFLAVSMKWAALTKKIPRRNRTPSAKKARTSPSSKSDDKTKESNEGKVSSSSQPKSLASKLAQFARSEPSRDARQADSDEDFQKEKKGLLDPLHFYFLLFLKAIII
jgi:hypothetical protein